LITDKWMRQKHRGKDIWLSDEVPRRTGRLVARITARGQQPFCFRYTDDGEERLPIGGYARDVRDGLMLAQASTEAGELSKLYPPGVRDIRGHLSGQERKREARRRTDEEVEKLALQQAKAGDRRVLGRI
jgi:hypothetical protein